MKQLKRLRAFSFLILFAFTVQSVSLPPSNLAPGNIVGGSFAPQSNRPTFSKVPSSSRNGKNFASLLCAVCVTTLLTLLGCPGNNVVTPPAQRPPEAPPEQRQAGKLAPPGPQGGADRGEAVNLPTYRPADIHGREMELGRQTLSQIERLEVPPLDPLDPHPYIEWMRSARNPRTGLIPSADGEVLPDGARPTWLYTTATGIKFLVQQGEIDFARQVADTVLAQQNSDGSWYFGRDHTNGRVISWEAKVGDVAWMALGLLDLYLATGDERYLSSILHAVDYLIPFQQMDPSHRRYGSFSGGMNGRERLAWTSTENNLDIAVLFYLLAQIDHPRINALELLARARIVIDWIVRPTSQGGMWDRDHFLIGYRNLDGDFSDFDEPTDAQTWTLLALQATQAIHPYRAEDYQSGLVWILPFIKAVPFNGRTVYGFSVKPYADIASVSPDLTMGWARAARLAGHTSAADFFEAQSRQLRDQRGFFPFMVGPADMTWPFNLRLAHGTPNHWAYFPVNPFVFNRDLGRGRAQLLRPLPEPATIEAKILLLSGQGQRRGQKRRGKGGKGGKKGRAGFIGRGGLAKKDSVERLVGKWISLPLPQKEAHSRKDNFKQWMNLAAQKMKEKIFKARQLFPHYFTEEEEDNLSEILKSPLDSVKIIPFEGGFFDNANFLLAFVIFYDYGLPLDDDIEDSYPLHPLLYTMHLGFNLSFINFLIDNARKFGAKPEELIAEILFHEILHIFINLPDYDYEHFEFRVHQAARRLQVKVFLADLLSEKLRQAGIELEKPTAEDGDDEEENRELFDRFHRQLFPIVQEILDNKETPLNKAIVQYISGDTGAAQKDRALMMRYFEETMEIGPFLPAEAASAVEVAL